ncbi:MAG TPA: hypothetical protein PK006_01880 [Saprospiraceae bacterium]|nr:hypothetical protein [Saprospiraceae bacterium]
MNKFFQFLFGLLLAWNELPCQAQKWSLQDSLIFWSDVMLCSTEPKFRTYAAEQFELLMDQNLSSKFQLIESIDFKNRIVKITNPRDGFTIFTWQYETDHGEWNYSGIARLPQGKVIQLSRESRNYAKINYENFDPSVWYGAMYYAAMPSYEISQSTVLPVMGFAQDHQGSKYRIVEHIVYNTESLSFGAKVFKMQSEGQGTELKNRLVIEYSKEANCAMEYDEQTQTITFDHIAAQDGQYNTSGNLLRIPDGTYESIQWDGTVWNHTLQLPVQYLKEAPREKPILDSKNKDLFGRPRKS